MVSLIRKARRATYRDRRLAKADKIPTVVNPSKRYETIKAHQLGMSCSKYKVFSKIAMIHKRLANPNLTLLQAEVLLSKAEYLMGFHFLEDVERIEARRLVERNQTV